MEAKDVKVFMPTKELDLREMVDLTLRPGRTVARALRRRPGDSGHPGNLTESGSAIGAGCACSNFGGGD